MDFVLKGGREKWMSSVTFETNFECSEVFQLNFANITVATGTDKLVTVLTVTFDIVFCY